MKRWACLLCHSSDAPHRKRDICDDCQASLEARSLAWCTLGRHRVQASAMTKHACRACKAKQARERYIQGQSAERARAWRTQNPDKRRTYNRRPDVMERRRAQTKASYRRNHTQRLEAARRRRAGRGHIYVARMRAYRHDHPGYAAEASRRQRERAKLRILQSWRRAA